MLVQLRHPRRCRARPIGPRVNIQDGAVIHGTFNSETRIDEGVSIGLCNGHGAHVQAGADRYGAVVLDGAVIGGMQSLQPARWCLKDGGSPRTLWAGVPAKQRSEVRSELQEHLAATADRYVEYASWFNR